VFVTSSNRCSNIDEGRGMICAQERGMICAQERGMICAQERGMLVHCYLCAKEGYDSALLPVCKRGV